MRIPDSKLTKAATEFLRKALSYTDKMIKVAKRARKRMEGLRDTYNNK